MDHVADRQIHRLTRYSEMHRFYIEPSATSSFRAGAQIVLPQQTSHQIRNVLRLRSEEQIALFDGGGSEWIAEISNSGTRQNRESPVTVRLTESRKPDVEMRTHVTMVMALTRPQRYELALAKCTELGANEFIPIITDRVLKPDAAVSANRNSRWNRIVIEAAELSGRVHVPKIVKPMKMSDAMNRLASEGATIIFLWEQTSEPMLNDLLISLIADQEQPAETALVLGPVGGFATVEVDAAIASGAIVASLGTRILRTETAAIASMSVAAQILR